MSFTELTIHEKNVLNELAEAKRMLEKAKAAAPETDGIRTDGRGNYYGVRSNNSCLPIPTTNIVGPDGDNEFERFED